ncbi:MAG TPA: carbamoyltransferase HypF [Streptosporangiaceae bacterium]|nr:carbamoyltransferase HypF [Streptosporangiaceae bacterium]
MTQRVRTAVRVEGTVQGVGFRPFVYGLATGLGLGGLVGNDADGVFAEIEGPAAAVAEFLVRLERDAPPLARVDQVRTWALTPAGSGPFTIVASPALGPGGPRRALVSPDTATCADCLRELADPADRRFGYPFINCTNCGPRFTIVRDVPYDRARTTMAPFTMCAACAAEYRDPANRRFHAEPTCCADCGPALRLTGSDGAPLTGGAGVVTGAGGAGVVGGASGAGVVTGASGAGVVGGAGVEAEVPGAVLAEAAARLRGGQILAIKGLGGYHLATAANDEKAVAALRARKHREDKPFAVMVAGVAAARELAEVDDTAERLLTSPRRPIVLLPRRPGAPVAEAVAPGNRQLGVMLPYTPLHHLLLGAVGGPIVLTSGNVSDEPIAYRDADASRRLGGIADACLGHDRAIHIRTDDSVSRPFLNKETVLRRSRGHVPEPVRVRSRFRRPVLAVGAELKNTFCLAKDDQVIISQHIGDLENAETLHSFTEGIEHLGRLFGIEPAVVAHDLHPEYLSTKYALDLDGVDLIGVQHHHAHIASCLADNGEAGPVIGVAFDGTGYGLDGTIWGGEFLVAGLAGFERAGHLAPVPLPGGAAAIRQPWRMAAAYLGAAYLGPGGDRPDVARRHEGQWAAVLSMARRGVNAPLTSSAGRLFDAVSALLGVRDTISYEGQAAVELEQVADPGEKGSYRAGVSGDAPFQVAGADLVHAAADDLARGVERPVIAARFHHGVAQLIEDGCRLVRDQTGLGTVALSGGVFQNLLLLTEAAGRLEAAGFRVLTHAQVPCNDGGISLGQAVIAAARDAEG